MSPLWTKYCNSTLGHSCSTINEIVYSVTLTDLKWQQKFLYADIFRHQNFLYVKFLCILIFCACIIYVLCECQNLTIWDSLWRFVSFGDTIFVPNVVNLWQCCLKLTFELQRIILRMSILVIFGQSYLSNTDICWILQINTKF